MKVDSLKRRTQRTPRSSSSRLRSMPRAPAVEEPTWRTVVPAGRGAGFVGVSTGSVGASTGSVGASAGFVEAEGSGASPSPWSAWGGSPSGSASEPSVSAVASVVGGGAGERAGGGLEGVEQPRAKLARTANVDPTASWHITRRVRPEDQGGAKRALRRRHG